MLAIRSLSSSEAIHGSYDPGTVEMLPVTPSGSRAARISTSRLVYSRRRGLCQSGR